MSTLRLLFLYPLLWKPISTPKPHIIPRVIPSRKRSTQRRCFHKVTDRKQETFPQRYGPAAEHVASIGAGVIKNPSAGIAERDISSTNIEIGNGRKSVDKVTVEASSETKEYLDSNTDVAEQSNVMSRSELDAEALRMKNVAQDTGQDRTNKPLEKVLHMEPPTSTAPGEHKIPHLHAPPYVHHFDTYGLVKDLEIGGFTQDQSVTLMKAVRGLLATNLDVAKEGLVSKSDIENVRIHRLSFPLRAQLTLPLP